MTAQPDNSASRLAEFLEANERLVVATLRAQAAEESLREAARHKDVFLAMLGHELRPQAVVMDIGLIEPSS